MARQRKTFDISLKLEVVRMFKEQGLSVQNAAPRPGSFFDRHGGSVLGRRQHWLGTCERYAVVLLLI